MSNTGGPAFPSKKRIYRNRYPTAEFEPFGGMTLRDYFAAKAMQVFLANTESTILADAKNAYAVADAMLEARK